MEGWHSAFLAAVQGLTEFLPISSSAHLILVPHLFGWRDQGLVFDVAVHVGTLSAVVLYFRAELGAMARDWLRSLGGGPLTADARLAWAVLWGTVPAGLAALALGDLVDTVLRAPLVIAAATVAFGLLLGWADRGARGGRDEHALTWRDVLVVGCAQALALVPGTSRSGITMTAGLFLGLSRTGAARFSFLLSVPVIALAGLKEGFAAASGTVASPGWAALAVGTLVAAVSAYLCIHFFLRLIQRLGMLPFVLYRLLLGGYLFWVFA